MIARTVQTLDRLRISLLRLALRIPIAKTIYQNRGLRLGFTFLLLSTVYLPLSLWHSNWLLIAGPLLLGYPHLISSSTSLLRLLPDPKKIPRFKSILPFHWILAGTGLAVAIGFSQSAGSWILELPNGSWEIYVCIVGLVCATLIFARTQFSAGWLASAITICGLGILLKAAHDDPLVFVGAALLLHNWVGFFFWFKISSDTATRLAAVFSVLVFAFIHYLIFSGSFDSIFLNQALAPSNGSAPEVAGWILLPSTNDPALWARATVIYAFGLSMHYFVWLKAIPESLHQHQNANSWRESFRLTSGLCGAWAFRLILLLSLVLVGLWLSHYDFGKRLYFRLASLHGWLEVSALIYVVADNLTSKTSTRLRALVQNRNAATSKASRPFKILGTGKLKNS